jgi:transcriptional regulator
MYNPVHFAISDVTQIHDFVRSNPFATLAAIIDGNVHFAYVPVILDATLPPHGTLHFHFARANPMASLQDGARITFSIIGAHAYVSPDWYESPDQVPTWNYTAVEGSGTVKRLDGGNTRRYLNRLAAEQEATLSPKQPWSPGKVAPERLKKLLLAIVGFELALDRLDGKAKLSQNKTKADIAGAIAALKDRGDAMAVAVAAAMQKTLLP